MYSMEIRWLKALVWYEAEKQEDGTYSIEVKGSDLAHEEGSYDVIVYGQAEGYDPSVIKTVTGRNQRAGV